MTRAAVGLGANLGDAAASVRAAVQALATLPRTQFIAASRLYRSGAWGVTAQPDFVNAVAVIETGLAPRELLDALLAIERRFGRTRVAGERWGPRTLDLDLLLFGDERIDLPGLQVPHPHLHQRAFALLPLLEAWPGAHIPGVGLAESCAAAMATGTLDPLP